MLCFDFFGGFCKREVGHAHSRLISDDVVNKYPEAANNLEG